MAPLHHIGVQAHDLLVHHGAGAVASQALLGAVEVVGLILDGYANRLVIHHMPGMDLQQLSSRKRAQARLHGLVTRLRLAMALEQPPAKSAHLVRSMGTIDSSRFTSTSEMHESP